jgi:hypothetical protein
MGAEAMTDAALPSTTDIGRRSDARRSVSSDAQRLRAEPEN